MPQYRTRQEQAKAELAKQQRADRKRAPMSDQQLDRFLFGQARRVGLLDGYQGPETCGTADHPNHQLARHLNSKLFG